MDNIELYKDLIRDLLRLVRQLCPLNLAREMFKLEDRAKELGIE